MDKTTSINLNVFLWACAVSLAVLLVACAASGPVLGRFSTSLYGEPGDNLGSHHVLLNVAGSLEANVGKHGVMLWRWSLPMGPEIKPMNDYTGALLVLIFGGAATYNLLILLSFPLSALTMFLLVFELTRDKACAGFAGAALAFSSFHVSHALHHLDIASIQWVPLFFFALVRLKNRPSPERIILLVLSTAILTLSSYYLAYISFLCAACLVLFWTVLDRNQGEKRRLAWLAWLGGAGLAGICFLLPVLIPVFKTARARSYPPAEDVFTYAARLPDYLIPPAASGGPVSVERSLYLGYTTLCLAILALVLYRKEKIFRAVLLPLALTGAAAVLLSGPPVFDVFGLSVPGPNLLLSKLAPMFRAVSRFGLVVLIFTLCLSAFGLQALTRRLPRCRGPLIAAAMLLVFFECGGLPWAGCVLLDSPELLSWLEAHTEPGGAVIDYPLYEYRYMRLPGAATAGSKVSFSTRSQVSGLNLEDLSNPRTPTYLDALGIRYVLWRDPSGGPCKEDPPPEGLARRAEFEEACVLEVESPTASYLVRFASGFSYPERSGDLGSYCWMGDKGTLLIRSTSGTVSSGTLSFQAFSLGRQRQVTVRDSQGEISVFLVSETPAAFSVDGITVDRRGTLLTLFPEPGAVVADTIYGNGDMRALSIGLVEPEFKAFVEEIIDNQ